MCCYYPSYNFIHCSRRVSRDSQRLWLSWSGSSSTHLFCLPTFMEVPLWPTTHGMTTLRTLADSTAGAQMMMSLRSWLKHILLWVRAVMWWFLLKCSLITHFRTHESLNLHRSLRITPHNVCSNFSSSCMCCSKCILVYFYNEHMFWIVWTPCHRHSSSVLHGIIGMYFEFHSVLSKVHCIGYIKLLTEY